jgi:hypothetical protein
MRDAKSFAGCGAGPNPSRDPIEGVARRMLRNRARSCAISRAHRPRFSRKFLWNTDCFVVRRGFAHAEPKEIFVTSSNRFLAHCARGAALVGLTLTAPVVAAASTQFGTLSNFDVFNDTGEDCHGFEIELEDLSPSDVVYTFGEPYQRYGNPHVVAYPGGVYVRYESAYDDVGKNFVASTPLAPAVITPTDGHACWTGGSGDYLTSGCEHFGVSLKRNPTRTVYRWLIADPGIPGSLKPAGTDVHIPAPIWKVNPPPPESPDQVNPVVAAVIEPPEPHGYEFGDALWMKIYVTETEVPADLDHLLSEDDRVPESETETEIEWELIQSEQGVPHKSEHGGQIKEGNKSVTRRYEFYEYVGPYDAETHEAKPDSDSNPLPGEVGNYIGAQMAAVNLEPAIVVTTTTTTTTSSSSTSSTLAESLCGDANDDGEIVASDAPAALKSAVGLSSACTLARCDTDGNGKMQASDALRILHAAVGQPVVMSCTA